MNVFFKVLYIIICLFFFLDFIFLLYVECMSICCCFKKVEYFNLDNVLIIYEKFDLYEVIFLFDVFILKVFNVDDS